MGGFPFFFLPLNNYFPVGMSVCLSLLLLQPSSRIVPYLTPSSFPSAPTSFPVPAEENRHHSMLLPPSFIPWIVCPHYMLTKSFNFVQVLSEAPFSTLLLSPTIFFFLSTCHSSLKYRTTKCVVISFFGCGSLQLIQSSQPYLDQFYNYVLLS